MSAIGPKLRFDYRWGGGNTDVIRTLASKNPRIQNLHGLFARFSGGN